MLMSRGKRRRAKSTVPKRTVMINGRKTSVSLEDAFWHSLDEIAIEHDMTRPELIRAINSERQHANLSAAIRIFVLDFYRQQIPVSGRPDK
jgi:predicted DNA-binding ribbon-helix-helix protein